MMGERRSTGAAGSIKQNLFSVIFGFGFDFSFLSGESWTHYGTNDGSDDPMIDRRQLVLDR